MSLAHVKGECFEKVGDGGGHSGREVTNPLCKEIHVVSLGGGKVVHV